MKNYKFLIFSAIGVFNTLFDVILYVILLNRTHSIVISNLITTSAALIGSYVLNSRFTFKARQWTVLSFVGFVLVTLFGLWVLQTGIIYGVTHFLHYTPERYWQLTGNAEKIAKAALPKLLATAVTLVWNYVWYSKVIFHRNSRREQIILTLDE